MPTQHAVDQTVYLNAVFDKVKEATTMVNANIATTLDTMGIYLDSLKELHRILSNDKVLSKGDAIRLIMSVRKIYSELEVWEQVNHVWVKFRDSLNDVGVEYKNRDMVRDLRIHDNIFILNRTIFSAARRLETLRKNKSSTI